MILAQQVQELGRLKPAFFAHLKLKTFQLCNGSRFDYYHNIITRKNPELWLVIIWLYRYNYSSTDIIIYLLGGFFQRTGGQWRGFSDVSSSDQ